jgi:hypothetical protein
MSEEIKTFIKRLKSDFHLDEIEKSLYFVNQKKILNKRLDTLNEKIADLNEKLGEPEKNNGGFKVSSNTVPLLMSIRQEKNKQETLEKEYNEEVEIFKRACKLDIQDTEIQTYSYEQIAEKPKELGDDQFIYISGNKIYLFKKKTYTIDEINCDWFTSFSKIILENKCLWMVLSEDYKRLFSLRPSDK